MKCGNCGKFTGLSELEPDDEITVDERGGLQGTVTLDAACTHCGDVVASCEVTPDFTRPDDWPTRPHCLAGDAREQELVREYQFVAEGREVYAGEPPGRRLVFVAQPDVSVGLVELIVEGLNKRIEELEQEDGDDTFTADVSVDVVELGRKTWNVTATITLSCGRCSQTLSTAEWTGTVTGADFN